MFGATGLKVMRPLASVVSRRPMSGGHKNMYEATISDKSTWPILIIISEPSRLWEKDLFATLDRKPAVTVLLKPYKTVPYVTLYFAGACLMAAGVGVRCIMTNPDVRVGKTKRTQIIRDWS